MKNILLILYAWISMSVLNSCTNPVAPNSQLWETPVPSAYIALDSTIDSGFFVSSTDNIIWTRTTFYLDSVWTNKHSNASYDTSWRWEYSRPRYIYNYLNKRDTLGLFDSIGVNADGTLFSPIYAKNASNRKYGGNAWGGWCIIDSTHLIGTYDARVAHYTSFPNIKFDYWTGYVAQWNLTKRVK